MKIYPVFRFAVALLFLVLLAHNSAHGDSFRVAHASDGFFLFEYALINNDGVVMFSALRRDSSGKVFHGVYKSRGAGIRTVAESPAFEATPPGQINVIGGSTIWINNRSLMALWAAIPGRGFTSVFVGSGTIGPAQEVGALFTSGLLPTITDDGLLAFGPIIRPYPVFAGFPPPLAECESCGGSGRLSNHRQYLRIESTNIHVVTIGPVTLEGTTFPRLQPILTNRVGGISEPARIAGIRAMLNDKGTVAYYDIPSAGVAGIYKKPATPFVEQRSGSEFTFNGAPPFAINSDNEEQVAFLAASRTLGKTGFFRFIREV